MYVAPVLNLQSKYRKSSRELKRLDSVTRSPLYIHLEECLEGRAVIRSHGPACMQSEEHTCLERLDKNQVRPPWGLGKVVGGWIAGTGVCVGGGGCISHTAEFTLVPSQRACFVGGAAGQWLTFRLQVRTCSQRTSFASR